MELLLEREYYPSGTNGILSIEEEFCCFTIELPWLDNRRMKSCIPEGRYPMALRFSDRHQWHLLVKNVPGRSLILIHKANNALQQLKGCIAPVMQVCGAGIGKHSKVAFGRLMQKVRDAIGKSEEIWLVTTRLSDRYGN